MTGDALLGPKTKRRLSDHIRVAFDQACDQGDFEVAQALLRVLEFVLTRPPRFPQDDRRRAPNCHFAAHERLWSLRHPSERG